MFSTLNDSNDFINYDWISLEDTFSPALFVASIDFSSREWASALVLLTLFLVSLILSNDKIALLRSVVLGLLGVIKAALNFWIALPATLIIIWSVFIFCLAFRYGLWGYANATDVIESIVLTGLGSMWISVKANSEKALIKDLVLSELAFSTLISVYIGLECFSLFIEYLIQLILTLIAIFSFIPSIKSKQKYRGLFDRANSLFGLIVFIGVTICLINDRNGIDWLTTVKSAAIPLWYALGLMPLVYLLSIFSNFQVLSERLVRTFHIPLRIRVSFYLLLGPRIRLVKNLGAWQIELQKCQSFNDVNRLVDSYKNNLAERTEVAKAKRNRYTSGIGARGFDENGIWLDARCFTKMRTALNTQMLIAQSRPDIKCSHADNLYFLKINMPSGCTGDVWISHSKQDWACWISNPSGFTLAIGLLDGGTDPLYYEGEQPPRFSDSNWKQEFKTNEKDCPNWSFNETFEENLL